MCAGKRIVPLSHRKSTLSLTDWIYEMEKELKVGE